MKIDAKLLQVRNKRTPNILEEVRAILAKNDSERSQIKKRLHRKNTEQVNLFNTDLLDQNKIFHIEDIKSLCIDYRLRFLDAHYFKGNIPEEAISKIRVLEKQHKTKIEGFKIVAPSKLLKLENLDDPLLFVPLGNDYYYLIHKWGNDLKWYRKLQVIPFKNIENLVVTLLAVSFLLAMITPIDLFTPTVGIRERITIFVFMFIWVTAIVLLYGGSKGKNFNNVIWNSQYYNV